MAPTDADALNYLDGRQVHEVNREAYRATALAHREGGVPNSTISLPKLDAQTLGTLIYFYERACAMSGYLLNVNPFDQPDVEAAKVGAKRAMAGELDLSSVPTVGAGVAADPLVGLLDSVGLERVTFCGLSLGGAVGMALALRAPDRVERLVLCCTAARFGEPQGWHERAEIVRGHGTGAVAQRVLERWFTKGARNEEAAFVARFRTMLESIRAEGYAACCDALAHWDVRAELGAIVAPTLVVAGADDIATPPDDAALIAEAIPGARLTVLPEAAHLANVEQPERFDATLLEFLSSTRSTEEAA